MKVMLWIFPILLTIALVLGGCRGQTLKRITKEATRSFVKLVVGMTLLCVAVQLLLLLVPVFY